MGKGRVTQVWDFLWMGEGARGGVGVIVSGEGFSWAHMELTRAKVPDYFRVGIGGGASYREGRVKANACV